MPEPVKVGRRYLPGLDGLRAIAVMGVFAYHLGLDGVPGGFLGVSVFFTLSGYLITDLILGRWSEGTFSLRDFWVARARRLLPAMALMLVVVGAWVTVIGPHQGPEFRVATLGAVLYVGNWLSIVRDVSYFAQFDGPSPIAHLWSLSVEEQFYIVWPVLVTLAARLIPERSATGRRPRLGLLVAALAVASFAAMQVAFQPGTDPSRVYYGTDTRAAELLIGAVLATLLPSQRLRAGIARGARRLLDGAGVIGLAVIAVMFVRVEETSASLYRGGFVVLGLAVAGVVAAVVHPAGALGRVIGCRPLRWIGARSYGLYLWHFPIIVLTTPSGTDSPSAGRSLAQVGATFAVTALSWRYVEDPIRRGTFLVGARRWRPGRVAGWTVPSAAAGAVALFAVAVAGFAGVGIERSADPAAAAQIVETVTIEPASVSSAPVSSAPVSSAPASPAVTATTTPAPSPTTSPTTARTTTGVVAPGPRRTSCRSVIHLGDSTSLGLVSATWIPDEHDRIPARYADVGVTTQHYEIAGGRSILEGYQDAPPAKRSAQTWRDQGYRGCWVVSMGTMDAAAVGRFDAGGERRRIDTMMAIADGDPVLWINAETIARTGYWRAEVMVPWNAALLASCAAYPNLRVYDWASHQLDAWFVKDKVHNNSEGYIAKAANIAEALAIAYPEALPAPRVPGSSGPGCLVSW